MPQKRVNPYRMVWSKGHPIAPRGSVVQEHRLILYDKIGPGSHPCHWCGKIVEWSVPGQPQPQFIDRLQCDHLDEDKANNNPQNLVPACYKCNKNRSNRQIVEACEVQVRIGNEDHNRRAEVMECPVCKSSFVRPWYVNRKNRKQAVCSRSCAGKLGYQASPAAQMVTHYAHI